MRIIITILLLINALIHLFGFWIVFQHTSVNKQVLGLSNPIGAVWLIIGIVFIIIAISFFKNLSYYAALITLCASQLLILVFWKEFKFVTVLNTILFLLIVLYVKPQLLLKK